MQERFEQIRSRMLKNAARSWGYDAAASETSFDPLVAMLLGTCASEFEKLSSDIHDSRSRVLEKMVDILSPESITGAMPAHAVVSCLPVEEKAMIKEDDQFYYNLPPAFAKENM